uniref:C2H2-type domain-containing protein n=1 Tax=Panagrolaimus sp. PS1159 TaxID=55785 RepID=A0AC35FUI6_9BILA
MGLNLGRSNDNNASHETSNSADRAEETHSKPDERRLASSNTSTESSTPTSTHESSTGTTIESNENPEDHFDVISYEAIPSCISDYVNKNQSISQPKLRSQQSSDILPAELPASSSSRCTKFVQKSANQNEQQKPLTSISSSQKSILDQISRLRKDCRRPMIIDAESLFDLQHVILGDYSKYKNIDPQLCWYYPKDPENLAPIVKCQSLHKYVLKGGSPLGWFFFSPKIDSVQIIFSNGFCITQDGIVNKRVANVANVKVQDEQGICNYISWWNREMSTFGFLFCSRFMTTNNQKQEVPIRSFMSNVACFPFSPTFKEVKFSFNCHAITRPFVMPETNIQIKSYLMLFVFRYGDAFPIDKLEIQPAAFATNLNEIFGTLRVYDLFQSKSFDLKFYRNFGDSLFLYEFPAVVDVDFELSVRFSIDFEKFGDFSDGLVLFGQIINYLSVNR